MLVLKAALCVPMYILLFVYCFIACHPFLPTTITMDCSVRGFDLNQTAVIITAILKAEIHQATSLLSQPS